MNKLDIFRVDGKFWINWVKGQQVRHLESGRQLADKQGLKSTSCTSLVAAAYE